MSSEAIRIKAAELAEEWRFLLAAETQTPVLLMTPEESAAFHADYIPVMPVQGPDGAFGMWGVRILGNIACGFAWDLGAAQAEIERLREALGECLMRLTDAAAEIRPTDPQHAEDIDETIKRYWLLPQKKESP